MWVDQLNHSERRVLVFIKCYEDVRRKHGQWGYKAFREQSRKILSNPVFKQFQTVVGWLDSKGWQVGWREKHWIGYIQFAFLELTPTIPQAGQLKNQVLLKRYILSSPNISQSDVNIKSLEDLYNQVVRSDISSHASLMVMFGLRGVTLCK